MLLSMDDLTNRRVDLTTLQARLKKRREALGLDQESLAERAGVSAAYISRLERGAVPNPKLFDLQHVAEALAVTVAELVAPEPKIVEMRFSHEWDELQKQTEGLPPEIREQVIRAWRESVAVMQQMSGLARRN